MTSSSAPQSQAKFTVVEFEYSADYPVKVELYLALHLAHIHAHTAMNGGKIVLIGPFLNNHREEKATTATGGLSIWRDATDEEITKYIETDPFVVHGLVEKWTVRPLLPMGGHHTFENDFYRIPN
ncbi:unnamed protein product [Rotaria magnacalcarata]|uniref:YCII-related domain-containing protein n=1 Tax=Rotaria magnacalcarata TaxID=392030 RepID=A0A816NP84_9BILA|nr:unnamed protein product [Rotaria magnacalcarata]